MYGVKYMFTELVKKVCNHDDIRDIQLQKVPSAYIISVKDDIIFIALLIYHRNATP